ncbi:MAG: HIT domain-containing protein [Phycisphaerales bacterium]
MSESVRSSENSMPPTSSPAPSARSDDARTQPAAAGQLWAPWRLEYLQGLADGPQSGPNAPATPSAGVPVSARPPERAFASFLARDWAQPEHDLANHVIVRSPVGMVLLNAFPYANGHLLVALGEGRPRLLDYSPQQRARLWELVDLATDLCEVTLQPLGINTGINQGAAAGAGVPSHLHVHLVPRWAGDTNFITVVGQVRVVPSSLEAMSARYREGWSRIRDRWQHAMRP